MSLYNSFFKTTSFATTCWSDSLWIVVNYFHINRSYFFLPLIIYYIKVMEFLWHKSCVLRVSLHIKPMSSSFLIGKLFFQTFWYTLLIQCPYLHDQVSTFFKINTWCVWIKLVWENQSPSLICSNNAKAREERNSNFLNSRQFDKKHHFP